MSILGKQRNAVNAKVIPPVQAVKCTSCTDLGFLHSYHIFSKDQLWRVSDQAAVAASSANMLHPASWTTPNKKLSNTVVKGARWKEGCIFSFSYADDSQIPTTTTNKKRVIQCWGLTEKKLAEESNSVIHQQHDVSCVSGWGGGKRGGGKKRKKKKKKRETETVWDLGKKYFSPIH